MGAVRFVCSVDSKRNHEEIKRLTYLARGNVMREKIYRDKGIEFEGELEVICEGGTLYREIDELGLARSIRLVEL